MYYYIHEPYYFVPRSESIQHYIWNNQETTPNSQFNEYYPQYLIRTYLLYPSYDTCHYSQHNNEWFEEWHNRYNENILTNINNLEINQQRLPFPSVSVPSVSVPSVSLPSISVPPVSAPSISVPSIPPICHGYTGYQTNKFNHQHNVESGGWVAGWADDIAEVDVAQGVVAAGVSVVSSNPAPFYAWVRDLVDRTISSLKHDVQQKFTAEIRNQINHLTADIISQAIQGKSPRQVLRKYDTFDFKAGAIRYSGRNMVCGNTVSTTWGMKPYIAIRIR
ncbi:hypothetical protein [Bacillus cereus]|uniref:hypothetical protein n=1 Tax=Bacillus cereus TaxID=1396 RepID=UPI00211D570A|nr:hypothetical protein [Bacillus cereus]